MLQSERTYLVRELQECLSGINEQIKSVHEIAANPVWGGEPLEVHRMQDTSGALMLAPLLIAKADVLVTLASLKKE